MPLIIPNATDTTSGNKYEALDQAEPDAIDFEALSLGGSGVLSGCVVSTASSSTAVSVSAGVVTLNGVPYSISANATFTLPTAPADKRFDLVVIRVITGIATLTGIKGTNSTSNPTFPKSTSVITGSPVLTDNFYPDTDILLAAVYRVGSTTITASKITDKRVKIASSIPDQGASAPLSAYGNGTGSLFYKTGTPDGVSSGVYVKSSAGPWIELAQNVGAHTPIGGVIGWPGAGSIPSGFVECNGQTLNVSEYPALYAILGRVYGGIAGSTFRVPDYNTMFLRGTTDTALVTGTALGSNSVTLTVDNLPVHAHTYNHTHDITHTHDTTHAHTATTDPANSHSHDFTHDHPSKPSSTHAGHTHEGFLNGDGSNDWFVYKTTTLATATGLWLTVNTSGDGNDIPVAVHSVTGSNGSHSHSVDPDSITATSATQAAHTHPVSVSAPSVTTSSGPSATTSGTSSPDTTGPAGTATSFSTVPTYKSIRWIMRASLGASTSYTGGITGPWSTSQTIVNKTASYTLTSSDVGTLVIMNVATANTLTIPSGQIMAPGQRIDVISIGAGQTTIAGSGTTVVGTPGLKIRAQYAQGTIICTGSNAYLVTGDLSA